MLPEGISRCSRELESGASAEGWGSPRELSRGCCSSGSHRMDPKVLGIAVGGGERHTSLCKAPRGEFVMETGWRVSQGIHPPWAVFVYQGWVKLCVLYPWDHVPALQQQTLGWSVLPPLLCKELLLVSQKAGGYLLLFQKRFFLSFFFFLKVHRKDLKKKNRSKTGYCLISEVINFGFSPL